MDDQHLKDQIAGQKIRDILAAVNASRPAMEVRASLIYVPADDNDYWREVAQRVRLEGACGDGH